jgi:hypothetical protein
MVVVISYPTRRFEKFVTVDVSVLNHPERDKFAEEKSTPRTHTKTFLLAANVAGENVDPERDLRGS